MKIFRYLDPEMIMTIVISLIVLSIGIFTFFTVLNQTGTIGFTIPSATTSLAQNASYYEYLGVKNGTVTTGNQVFNVVGIVLIIGAIMTIVGLIMSYVRPGQ